MFENLTVESEERRTSESAPKVDASPEVTAIVLKAWAAQQESEKSMGHIVGIGDPAAVEQFHLQARAACTAHEPRIKYRKLTQVGKSKDVKKAYFAVSAWPAKEADDENAPTPDEAPEATEPEATEPEAAKPTRAPARSRAAK